MECEKNVFNVMLSEFFFISRKKKSHSRHLIVSTKQTLVLPECGT